MVDSNVILDVFTEDRAWFDWSASRLAEAYESSRLAINPIIYAEISVRFRRIEELEAHIPRGWFERRPLPYEAGFLAGKIFAAYRWRGGTRRSPMPDFYIGAHASVEGMTLLTRDPNRYRTYLPRLRLIAPADESPAQR